jgi:hypothetical protein
MNLTRRSKNQGVDAKKSWWSSLNEQQRKLISNVAIGLGISVVAAGVIFFGVKFYKKQVANFEENKSFGADKHATWAKQIKNAFDNNGWWGTDEVLLRNTLREIPSMEDVIKVRKSYKKQFDSNMMTVLTDELKQTEYDEMLAIVNAKPKRRKDVGKQQGYDVKSWAKRINAAINYNWLGFGWGTDEEAIKAVFMDMPTKKAYWETKRAYQKLYGTDMKEDLQADMDDLNAYLKIIWAKPEK